MLGCAGSRFALEKKAGGLAGLGPFGHLGAPLACCGCSEAHPTYLVGRGLAHPTYLDWGEEQKV